jgi:hypothetical protein
MSLTTLDHGDVSKMFQLKIVPAPDPGTLRTVIDFDAPGAKAMEGPDMAPVDLYCGQCGALLVTSIPKRNVKTSVIRCKLCRAFNDPSGISMQ